MQKRNDRLDIATRTRHNKDELLRLCVVNGVLTVANQGGRGFYIARSQEAFDKALARKAFTRILHRDITAEELAAIKEAL